MDKTPHNIREDWKPNHDEMRELMLKATILNEEFMANGEARCFQDHCRGLKSSGSNQSHQMLQNGVM